MIALSTDADLAVRWSVAERVRALKQIVVAQGNRKGVASLPRQAPLLPTVAALVCGVVCDRLGLVLSG